MHSKPNQTENLSTESTNTNNNDNAELIDNVELVDAELTDNADDQVNDNSINLSHHVTVSEVGNRLDKIAALAFYNFSRVQLQGWIANGELTVNDKVQKPKYRVKANDVLQLTTELTEHGSDQPEDIAIDVMYEDEHVAVINKPVGMVVHPGAGNWTGTLVNALLHHYPNNSHLPRAGLVHRIDKDTSGLLIIAKNKAAQLDLTEQLKDKSVYRHYKCVVAGSYSDLQRHKVIDLPIGRHKSHRIKMAITSSGKEAVTHLMKITELHENYSLVDVALETGRTHQIRVHLDHISYPLVGDKVYGQHKQLRAGLLDNQREFIRHFPRQALHAYKLGFIHPETGEDIRVSAPLPADILELIEVLK